jgi:hypothetical protein
MQTINVVTDYNNVIEDDDATVLTSNCLSSASRSPEPTSPCSSLVAMARQVFGSPSQQYLNAITIKTNQAIADTGATSIFIIEGTPVNNLRPSSQPLTINLLDGSRVKSTHMCNITIPGLPVILTGHIVPKLTIALLIGIRVLCDAGCTMVFTKAKFVVIYNGKIILRGYKDPSTDLWTLPIDATAEDTKGKVGTPHKTTSVIDNSERIDLKTFTHSVRTRANSVMFAHQSLCNPKISMLLKATRRGFVRGCPNMSKQLILKYLNPSPATAKGHMKQPRHGIRSTTNQ